MPIIKPALEEIILTPANSIEISKGESPKSFLTDGLNLYVFKKPKKRTLAGIFKDLSPSLTSYKHWTIDDWQHYNDTIPASHREELTPYIVHLKDLLFEAAFGEVLFQPIAAALMKDFEATESYLHVNPDGEAYVISKFHAGFNEFVEKKLKSFLGDSATSTDQWDTMIIPIRDDLQFHDNEHYLLGKLYALALITNDWDLVNNIMLSNSGCLGSSLTATKIMVVDGGNKFHFGFEGFTCDETSFKNKDLNPHAPASHPRKGYQATLPFDSEAALFLPRLLIEDLFSLTNPSIFRGFKEGIQQARTALIKNPYCIQEAINKAKQLITCDSDSETLTRFKEKSTLLNHSYYYPRDITRTRDYNLNRILQDRCNSLHQSCMRIEEGVSPEVINREILEHYISAQDALKSSAPKIKAETPDTPMYAYLPTTNNSFSSECSSYSIKVP